MGTTGPADEAPGVTAAAELLEEFEEAACPSPDEERRDTLRLLPTTGRIFGAHDGRSVLPHQEEAEERAEFVFKQTPCMLGTLFTQSSLSGGNPASMRDENMCLV